MTDMESQALLGSSQHRLAVCSAGAFRKATGDFPKCFFRFFGSHEMCESLLRFTHRFFGYHEMCESLSRVTHWCFGSHEMCESL